LKPKKMIADPRKARVDVRCPAVAVSTEPRQGDQRADGQPVAPVELSSTTAKVDQTLGDEPEGCPPQ